MIARGLKTSARNERHLLLPFHLPVWRNELVAHSLGLPEVRVNGGGKEEEVKDIFKHVFLWM